MAALLMTGLLYLMLGSRMLLGEWNSAIGFTSGLLQINSSLCNLTTFFMSLMCLYRFCYALADKFWKKLFY